MHVGFFGKSTIVLFGALRVKDRWLHLLSTLSISAFKETILAHYKQVTCRVMLSKFGSLFVIFTVYNVNKCLKSFNSLNQIYIQSYLP